MVLYWFVKHSQQSHRGVIKNISCRRITDSIKLVSYWCCRRDDIRTGGMCAVLLVVWALLVLVLVLHFGRMVWMFRRSCTVWMLQHIQKLRNRELCSVKETGRRGRLFTGKPGLNLTLSRYFVLLKRSWARCRLCFGIAILCNKTRWPSFSFFSSLFNSGSCPGVTLHPSTVPRCLVQCWV